MLTQHLNKDGYPMVVLFDNGRMKNYPVHRMVCIAFHGLPPFEGAQALHIDKTKVNTKAANLRWGTHQDNMDDMVAARDSSVGERSGRAKLTWEIVRQIRKKAEEGGIPYRIAKEFGISQRHCTLIIRNEMWYKHRDPENAKVS